MGDEERIFEPETIYYPDRDKLDVFEKQIGLLDSMLEEFKSADVTTKEAVEVFFQRVKQVYQDYQHQLTEIQYDILSEFRDIPGFKNWFKRLLSDEANKKKENAFEKFKLYGLTKTDFIDKMKRLMRYQAKSLIFNAILNDIYYSGLEKLYMISKNPFIPDTKVAKSEGERLAHLHYNEGKLVKDIAKNLGKPAKDIWALIAPHKNKVLKTPLTQSNI